MSAADAKAAFATEADLCREFVIDLQQASGWTVYPETGGFDLLCVRDDTGLQLGIEAKLQLNAKVIEQILPTVYGHERGPTWRAVLVPFIGEASQGLARLLEAYGVMCIAPRFGHCSHRGTRQGGWHDVWHFQFCDPAREHSYPHAWFDWNPVQQCELPDFVPTVAAGVPAPVKLSPWKVGAMRVLADLELDGFVTAKSVRERGINPTAFCSGAGWLASIGNGRWAHKAVRAVPMIEHQHPEQWAAILAEERSFGATPAERERARYARDRQRKEAA